MMTLHGFLPQSFNILLFLHYKISSVVIILVFIVILIYCFKRVFIYKSWRIHPFLLINRIRKI